MSTLSKNRLPGVTLLICMVAGSHANAAESSFSSLRQVTPPERQAPQTGLRSLGPESSRDTIRMQHGSFRLDPTHIPQLTTTQGYLLLQLTGPLTDEWRNQLETLQVNLLEYIPDNTWSSRVHRHQLQAIHDLPFVRAMGKLYPGDKLPASLLNHDLSPRAKQGGQVTLDVSFQPDQSLQQAVAALQTVAATPLAHEYSSGQQLRITLPYSRLLDLANLEAVRWIEEPAAPIMQENVSSANLIQVTALQQQLPDLLGNGVVIGGWEGGTPQSNHPDLAGRITIAQSSANTDHATHVTGTLIGNGKSNSLARGMAPAAQYISYDFYGDIPAEMAQAIVSYKAYLSNHSWGYMVGWTEDYYGSGWTWFGNPNEESDSNFGRYSSLTQQWDHFINRYDGIVVKSVGNNRNDHGVAAGRAHHHHGDSITLHYDSHKSDSGYDSLEVIASAKNIITVGAVDDNGGLTSFSGWGPTDDGRIKPDLVANGTSVLSTFANSNYGVMSGTSMAAPAATGALALLTELYSRHFTNNLSAATAKALLIQTATDLGNAGPDYQFGWGLINANAAATLIRDDQGSGLYLRQASLSSAGEITLPINVTSVTPELRVTIAWTDPAGSPAAASALVNDLDLELVAPDGTLHYPFSLNGLTDPAAPARRDRANHTDNVEQVRVAQPLLGQWQLRIRGYRVQGSQPFTIVSSNSLNNTGKAATLATPTPAPSNSGNSNNSGGGGTLGFFSLLLLVLATRRRH